MAFIGAGSYFSYELSGVYVPCAEVVSISGPQGSFTDVDATHLLSANVAKDFLAGFEDGGTITLELNMVPATFAALRGFRRLTKLWRVTFASGSQWNFAGHINAYGSEIPVDDKVSASIGIKVTGMPVFSA